MVGGRDFGASQFNRATQARRQPGSLFKPIVYLAGLTHPGDPGRRYREDDEDEGDEGGWRERMRRRRSRSEELVLAPGGALLPPFGEVVAASWTAGGARPPAGAVVPAARGERDPRGGRRWWWQREEDEEEPEEPEADANEPPPMPLTAATVLKDEPYEVVAGGKLWSPRNDDDAFRGPVTVQRAIEDSLNVPTARAAAAIGLDRIVETGRALGIASPLPAVPSLALGSAEVTPAEMAGAFATIAAEGRLTRPHLLRGVERPSGPGASGRILPAGSVPGLAGRTDGEGAGRQAVPREAALVMTALLEGVLDHGTGYSARSLGFEGVAAGKTGTSDGGRDLWFCGYTPDVLALVWVGYDEPAPTRLSGSMAALPIWVDFMRSIGADTRAPFEGDEELAWAAIDPATGGLARIACPETRWAPFVPGTEPTEECREHGSIWRRLFGRD
jgi:membrane carboxypeptidase/penicillin-binding protein